MSTSVGLAPGPGIVDFGAESHDEGGAFTTDAFTAPLDGVYHFDANLQIISAAGFVQLLLNGSPLTILDGDGGAGGNFRFWGGRSTRRLSAGDVVQVAVQVSTGGTLARNGSYFSGHLIYSDP